MEDLVQVRREFTRATLRRRDLLPDPLVQVQRWLGEAQVAGEADPYAMTLATVNGQGEPTARVVSLKQVDERGLVFTSSGSPKVGHLEIQSAVALVLYWPTQERQVRIQGRAERLSTEESERLYTKRAHEQRLALLVAGQSCPVSGREALDTRFAELAEQYAGQVVPRPAGWNGWRVVPSSLEFWQGGRFRLHDRLRYTPLREGWQLDRLAP